MNKKRDIVINNKKLNSLQKWVFEKKYNVLNNIFVKAPLIISTVLFTILVIYLSYKEEVLYIIYSGLALLSIWYIMGYIINNYVFDFAFDLNTNFEENKMKLTRPYFTCEQNVLSVFERSLSECKNDLESPIVKVVNNCSGHTVFDQIRRQIAWYVPSIVGYMEAPNIKDIKEALINSKIYNIDLKLANDYDFKNENIEDLISLYAEIKDIKITDNFKKRALEQKTKRQLIEEIEKELIKNSKR